MIIIYIKYIIIKHFVSSVIIQYMIPHLINHMDIVFFHFCHLCLVSYPSFKPHDDQIMLRSITHCTEKLNVRTTAYITSGISWDEVTTLVREPGFIVSPDYPFIYSSGEFWVWDIHFNMSTNIHIIIYNASFNKHQVIPQMVVSQLSIWLVDSIVMDNGIVCKTRVDISQYLVYSNSLFKYLFIVFGQLVLKSILYKLILDHEYFIMTIFL